MKNQTVSVLFFVASIVFVVFAVLDSMGVSIWLGATSWLVVALVFAVWSVYFKDA